MTTIPTVPQPKRKWYALSLRHLRMASRLLDSGFADGAVFHTYHAYECVLSAFIAAKGHPVPPDGRLQLPGNRRIYGYRSARDEETFHQGGTHKIRQILFGELANQSKPYYAKYQALSRYISLDDRMDSLYYDTRHDRLPQEIYNSSFAVGVITEVRLFAREVWKEIR